jgi:hypothetical protein
MARGDSELARGAFNRIERLGSRMVAICYCEPIKRPLVGQTPFRPFPTGPAFKRVSLPRTLAAK